MCLTVKSADQIIFKVAKKDIVVFKKLRRKKLNSDGESTYTSPYQDSAYIREAYYTSVLGVSSFFTGDIDVNQGLHAYTTRELCKTRTRKVGNFIAEMVIPKRALYCIGANGDIVSTRLYWPPKKLKKAKK